MKPSSILVFAPSWIGDAVMSLGAVRALSKSFPEASFSMLTRSSVRELYDGCEAVDRHVLYDPHGADRGLAGFFRAADRVRRESFDLCVLLPNAFRAAAFVRAAGVPERWGFATESRSMLLTRSVPQPPRPFGRHQTYFYLDLLRGLGLEVTDGVEPDNHLDATESMRASARALLEQEGWRGGPLIGVHPGATNSRAKIWAPSRHAAVASRLAEERDAQVVVLGGPDEGHLAHEAALALPEARRLELQGKTSLGELMGVLSHLTVLLSNDSGPMHLAAALGVPTVAVFGPTDARETGPFSRRARVVREPVDCSPCTYRDCPIDHRCMERVDPDRVYDEAIALVSSAS